MKNGFVNNVTGFFDNNKEKSVVQHKRRETDKPPTVSRIKKMHESPSSFTNLLPWHEYNAESNTFVLSDGKSHGIAFELRAIGTEGATEDYLSNLKRVIQTALTETIPEDHAANWVVQFFLQDDTNIAEEIQSIRRYVKRGAKNSKFTEEYLQQLEEHYKQISQNGGLFVDHATTGTEWAGKVRRVRVCIYRYIADDMEPEWENDREEINEIGDRFKNQLTTTGINIWRTDGKSFYDWMFRWFNPNPLATEGDVEKFLEMCPYPGDESLPIGYDLSEMLLHTYPESDDDGVWYFDGVPHKTITVGALRRIPETGLITGERQQGDHLFASFDRFPDDSILSFTIQIKPQDELQNHIAQIKQASYGDSAEAEAATEEASIAQQHIIRANKLYPIQMVVYIKGKNKKQLLERERSVYSQLLSVNLQPIYEKSDVLIQDSYIRNLPMNYDPIHDQKNSHRSMLAYSSQIAALLPIYGRERGTGNPGWSFFNRGGEPITVDPLNSLDRSKNAHALIIGPTGAGKSATLVYLIQQALAIYRPRIFVIEAGNSFGLLGDYLQEHDVSVNQITLNKSANVSLPPFADAQRLLDERSIGLELSLGVELDELDAEGVKLTDDDEDEDRDLLGEMEIAARIMITGGDPKEAAALMRPDLTLIRKAIFIAAEYSRSEGREQTLTEDVVYGLRNIDGLEGKRKERAELMADGMELFCTGLAGKFFNREGISWPDKDLTIVDMGILAREGYEDQLTVAYIGLMNHIHSLVEREQHSNRQTIVITDEGHIITTNPLLAPYVIKIVKMWRKLGAWYWIATQNLEDFPDASRKMLNMLEWWMCLVMPKDEIEQIARFKDLTAEQKGKLLSAKKSSGQYTEGVILTDSLNLSFRNVPPALTLALAMTEKEEKSERMEIMEETGCTEAQAAEVVAQKIIKKRQENAHA